MVDPRAPRFGQALTASGLLGGVLFAEPAVIYAFTLVLAVPVLTRWRVDLYAILWRSGVGPVLEPATPEPAAPHRFAKLIGAVGTVIASGLVLSGLPLLGYLVAAAIGFAAGLAATTGICLGCRMYRSVSLFNRLDIV